MEFPFLILIMHAGFLSDVMGQMSDGIILIIILMLLYHELNC